MAIHGWSKQTNTKKIDFSRFLCSTPARDYIFQDTPYENQIREAAELLSRADAVLIGGGAGLSTANIVQPVFLQFILEP